MQQSLTQYKTFYEVAKSENVSKASRILLISQPAVSKSIKKLEDKGLIKREIDENNRRQNKI